MNALDSGTSQKFDTVEKTIFIHINHPFDSRLDNQFRALHTRRCRNIEGGTLRTITRLGHFRDGISLSVKNIRLSNPVFVFADIFESRRRSVIAIGNNHPVLDYECAYLSSFALGILSPYLSHLQVPFVEFVHYLFF